MTPAEREQRRLAANERWSKQDPGPFMARVREGQIQKWRQLVIEEARGSRLTEAEIARRIDAKRRAHYNRMTLAAMKARKLVKDEGRGFEQIKGVNRLHPEDANIPTSTARSVRSSSHSIRNSARCEAHGWGDASCEGGV